MIEKKIKSESIYKGKIIDVKLDTVELSNGKQATREVVDHAPAVVILPYDENYYYLIKQYRHAIENILIEVPAGIINKNENTLLAAKRELKEETGFTAKTWKLLGEAYPTPGFCNEYMYFYSATDLTLGETNFDEDEYVEVVKYTKKEIDSLITKNTLIDAKTLLILLLKEKKNEN